MVLISFLLGNKAGFLGELVAFFSHLRLQVSMDPLTNLPAVSFDRAVSVAPESIEKFFELIRMISQEPLTPNRVADKRDVFLSPDSVDPTLESTPSDEVRYSPGLNHY